MGGFGIRFVWSKKIKVALSFTGIKYSRNQTVPRGHCVCCFDDFS